MLSPLVKLRAEVAARAPGWRDSVHARRHLLQEIVHGLSSEGRLDIHARGNRLLGFVLAWWEPEGWTGGPLHRVVVEVAPDSPAAADWAAERILSLGSLLDGPLDLRVNAEQTSLRDRLVANGLGIDSVVLVGAPGPALVMLQARWQPPTDLRHLGLDIAPMAPHFVEDAVRLRERVFDARPELCWFGAMPGHLARTREELQQQGPGVFQRVILQDGELVGSFSTRIDADPCWGRTAGVDLVLDPTIQRKGVSRTLYLQLLDWMVAQQVDCFRGGTAQPAVMRVGRALGRVPFETNHRKRTTFPRAHFDPVLGPVAQTLPLEPA